MTFKSKLGIAALEELNEVSIPDATDLGVAQDPATLVAPTETVEELTAATEGLKGAALGAVAGLFGFILPGAGAIAGGVLSNGVEQAKKEIEALARELEKVAMDNGKKAVSEGKITAEDFRKNVESVGMKGVIRGAIYGALFGPIYTAIKGSEMEDLREKLEQKCKELNRLLEQAAKDKEVAAAKKKTGKLKKANESEDESGVTDEGDVDTAAVPAADAAPAADTAPAADATTDAPAADTAVTDAPAADATATADAPAADATASDPSDVTTDSAAAAAVAAVDAAGEPPEVVAEVVDADAEVVEEEMGEVDEIEEKTEDVSDDVEKLAAATESLEGCVSILTAAAQRGGLDIFGASLLRNNINTVTSSLKVKPLMLPALEDMETPSSKIDGANSAKDQIVAFIKRIIEAIQSAFTRLSEWIVETYKRLTNAFVAIERRAEKLASRIQASTMKEGKLDSKGIATKMSVGGKPVEDLSGFLTKLMTFSKYLNDPKSYQFYLQAADLCEQLIKNPEKDEEIRGQISAVLARWAKEMSGHACDISQQEMLYALLNGGKGQLTSEKMITTFYLGLLNNQALIVAIPECAEGLRRMSTQIAGVKAAPATSIDAMDKAAALKVCGTVAGIAKAIRESGEAHKGGVKELVEEIKKRKDTIVAMSTAAGDQILKDVGLGDRTRKAVLFINAFFVTSPNLPVHGINRALPRNLSYALDYVAASIGGAEPKAAA